MNYQDYWPNNEQYSIDYNYGQVSCIDRQIAELQARKDALLHGYCFTGYTNTKSYLDPYNLEETFTK